MFRFTIRDLILLTLAAGWRQHRIACRNAAT
jgi:hypothetical protein